jgi:AcrR family transcriptional regulator
MSPRTATQLTHIRSERKEQILQAASSVFSHIGFHAANVSDVAKEAHVSQGTVYHYFKSKEELFMAVFEAWETESFSREVRAVRGGSASAAERLRQLAEAVGKSMEQTVDSFPASVEFWSHIHRNAAVQEGFQRIFADLRSTLANFVREGIVRGEFVSMDPNAVASLLIAVYDGLVLQWLADPQSVDWQVESTALVNLVLHGLLKTNESLNVRKDG